MPDRIENEQMFPGGSTELSQNITAKPGIVIDDDPSERPVGIASIALSLTTFYILLAQVAYCLLRRNECKNDKMMFNVLCALSSFVTLCRVGIPHLKHELVCGFLHDFEAVAFALAYALLWTTLWLRQYYFYQSPTLRSLYSSWLRGFSFSVEILIIACFVVSVVEYFATRYIDLSNCIHDEFEESKLAWSLIFATYIIFQGILLGLLIYPLHRHRKTTHNSGSCGSSKSNNAIQLKRIIFRTAVTSAMCIVFDMVSLPIRFLLDDKLIALFLFILNVNLVAQLIAVIASFRSWKKRFFPWKAWCRKSNGHERSCSAEPGSLRSGRASRTAHTHSALTRTPSGAASNGAGVRTISSGSSINWD